MNIVVLAISLGPFPVSIMENAEATLAEIHSIFPEGAIELTTTGDELRASINTLSPLRQNEILTKQLDGTHLDNLTGSIHTAQTKTKQAENNFGFFLVMLALTGLLVSAMVVGYVIQTATPVVRGLMQVEKRINLDSQRSSDP